MLLKDRRSKITGIDLDHAKDQYHWPDWSWLKIKDRDLQHLWFQVVPYKSTARLRRTLSIGIRTVFSSHLPFNYRKAWIPPWDCGITSDPTSSQDQKVRNLQHRISIDMYVQDANSRSHRFHIQKLWCHDQGRGLKAICNLVQDVSILN